MQKKRPVAVLVMAVLSLIYGSLGALSVLIMACAGIFFYSVYQSAFDAKTKEQFGEIYDAVSRDMPGLVTYTILSLTYSLIAAIFLLITGIGLLKMRRWARMAAITYAVISILALIPNTIYSVAYLQPGIERFQRGMEAKHPRPPAAPAPVFEQNRTSQLISAGFGVVVGLALPVALIIVMMLPHVAAAFAAQDGKVEPVEKREAEEEDFYRRE